MPQVIPPPTTRVKVYIVTHGPKCSIIPDYCEPIEVGCSFRNQFIYQTRDDSFEGNISAKNKEWCEITGLYYIWRKDTSDITGLYHYRRAFNLKKDQIIRLLRTNDVIAADVYVKPQIKEFVKKGCPSGSFDCALEAIKNVQPDYYEDACKIMDGHFYYACQMFVAKHEWMDAYCEWMFSILNEIERIIKPEQKDPRYMGYIAELLCLATYIEHNKYNVAKQSILYFDDKNTLLAKFMKSSLWSNQFTHSLKNIVKKLAYKI